MGAAPCSVPKDGDILTEITAEQQAAVAWAIREYSAGIPGFLQTRAQVYRMLDDYYHGRQRLLYASEKFRNTFGSLFEALCENLCPLCVDVVADRLQIENFSACDETARDVVNPVTQEVWRRNRMRERSGEVMKDALRQGDGYVLVWPDETGQPVLYPNAAGTVVAMYDPEKIGLINMAAKQWAVRSTNTDNALQGRARVRLNLYYPDRIEKYISRSETAALPSDPNVFLPYVADSEPWPLPNPYGKVPVFHFANNAAVGQLGRSELADVIPLQDALNKSICDMLVAMEFESYAQRWATGVEPDKDEKGLPIAPFKSGIDRLWMVADANAKFGEFGRSNLEHFIHVSNSLRAAVARVSGIPAHYLMFDKGGWPSGESLKTADARLTAKVEDRQLSFGMVWADVMRFALQVLGQPDVDIDVNWVDTSPRATETEIWTVAGLKMAAGVSQEQVLLENGYTEDQIDEFKQDNFDMLHGDGYPAPPAGSNGAPAQMPDVTAMEGAMKRNAALT